MVLSTADKALAEAAYSRVKSRYGTGIAGPFIVIFALIGQSALKDLRDPHTPHRYLILISALIGLGVGMCIISSFFFSRQRKRDLELVRFFEKHFPGDCSWKQEEKILAAAEDLRLKAKVDCLIHKSA